MEIETPYCLFWSKNLCKNRVESPGLKYCKNHQKFEGTDQKHDKTPAKEKKEMVLPKAAKPKLEEPGAPKVCDCVFDCDELIIACERCLFARVIRYWHSAR